MVSYENRVENEHSLMWRIFENANINNMIRSIGKTNAHLFFKLTRPKF